MAPQIQEWLWVEALVDAFDEGWEQGYEQGYEEGLRIAAACELAKKIARHRLGEDFAHDVALVTERLDSIEALEELLVGLVVTRDEEAVRAIVARFA
jgi:flagellar biosynthesis/type III secretory pathway protein FliH